MPLPDAARARRAAHARIRHRVTAAALATFVLAWGVIAADGSMGAEATTADAGTTPPSSTDSTTSPSTGASSDAVTTAQS